MEDYTEANDANIEQCWDLFRVFFETCLVFSESERLQLKDCIHLTSLELIMRIMRIALIMLSMLLVHDSMLIIQVGSHLTFKRDVFLWLIGSQWFQG